MPKYIAFVDKGGTYVLQSIWAWNKTSSTSPGPLIIRCFCLGRYKRQLIKIASAATTSGSKGSPGSVPSARITPRLWLKSIKYAKEEKVISSPENSRALYSSSVRGWGISCVGLVDANSLRIYLTPDWYSASSQGIWTSAGTLNNENSGQRRMPANIPSERYNSHQVLRQLSSKTGLPSPLTVANDLDWRLISRAIPIARSMISRPRLNSLQDCTAIANMSNAWTVKPVSGRSSSRSMDSTRDRRSSFIVFVVNSDPMNSITGRRCRREYLFVSSR